MAVRIILDNQDESKLLEVLHAYAGMQQRKYNQIPFEDACSDEAVRYMRGRDWANKLIGQINGKYGRCDPEPHITKMGRWLNAVQPEGKGYYIARCSSCGEVGYLGQYCCWCGSKNPESIMGEDGEE